MSSRKYEYVHIAVKRDVYFELDLLKKIYKKRSYGSVIEFLVHLAFNKEYIEREVCEEYAYNRATISGWRKLLNALFENHPHKNAIVEYVMTTMIVKTRTYVDARGFIVDEYMLDPKICGKYVKEEEEKDASNKEALLGELRGSE